MTIERPQDVRVERRNGNIIPCELSYAGMQGDIAAWNIDTEVNLAQGDILHIGYFPARTTLLMPTRDDTDILPAVEITTRRSRLKQLWREILHPLFWWTVAIIILFCAVTIPRANAEPLSPGEQFASKYAVEVCLALDSRPTVGGLVGLLEGLHVYGLSDYESGVAVASSVITVCPMYQVLLRQFVEKVRSSRAGVVA